MAGYNSSNPFFTEEDDKGNFGSRYDSGSSQNPFQSDAENRRNEVLTQIHASEDRQLESTRRMLQSIDESERIGVATGEVTYTMNNITSSSSLT